MHYNDCTAPHIFAWMYPSATFLKLHTKIMIIGCKLATTEYGAETFSQSQLKATIVENR